MYMYYKAQFDFTRRFYRFWKIYEHEGIGKMWVLPHSNYLIVVRMYGIYVYKAYNSIGPEL